MSENYNERSESGSPIYWPMPDSQPKRKVVQMTDAQFLLDVEKAIRAYEAANEHPATRTRKLIQTHGEVEALSLLMMTADLQQGFKVLRDTGQLDKTFESIVVKYQGKFQPDVVDAAKWRLAHAHDLL